MSFMKCKIHLLVCLMIIWLPVQLRGEMTLEVPSNATEEAQDVVQSEMGETATGTTDSTTQIQSAGVEESPVPDAYVARAVFTTDVIDREPVDQIVSVDQNATQVMFFTDLRNLQGRTVTHRWEFEGSVISEVQISVKGPRWRAYSVKSLNPGEVGKWTVFVIDESGWPLHASILQQRVSEE
jgi:hypothetical protein